jgi:hypothetical protein
MYLFFPSSTNLYSVHVRPGPPTLAFPPPSTLLLLLLLPSHLLPIAIVTCCCCCLSLLLLLPVAVAAAFNIAVPPCLAFRYCGLLSLFCSLPWPLLVAVVAAVSVAARC